MSTRLTKAEVEAILGVATNALIRLSDNMYDIRRNADDFRDGRLLSYEEEDLASMQREQNVLNSACKKLAARL